MERSVSPPKSRKRIRLSDSPDHGTCSKTSLQHRFITIYSWNVNGISPFLQPSVSSYFTSTAGQASNRGTAKASLRDFLRRHGWPTVLFLQEVKINPDDAATKRAVQKAVGRQSGESLDEHDYEAHFCLPHDKYNARGFGRKVYGVCSIVRKDFMDMFVETIRPVSWDAEGRILVMESKAVGNIPKLQIFNIYAVNGTDLPYRDTETGITVGTRHDRKLKVHELLEAEYRELEARGFGIVLAGDMNIARTRIDGHPNLRTFPQQHCLNRADFEARFFVKTSNPHQPSVIDMADVAQHELEKEEGGLGMIDTFRHLHPQQKSYTYYPRTKAFGESCDRVDMIMLSSSLQNNLKEAGMHETPSERGPSDHVPLFAVLEFEER